MTSDAVIQNAPTTYAPLSSLSAWGDNYNEGDVGKIIMSLREFGYNRSIAVWNGVVMAGNHTFLALTELKRQGETIGGNLRVEGDEWHILVSDLNHLSEEEAVAYAIADNKTASAATTNLERLTAHLQSLKSRRESLFEATGYDNDDLQEMLAYLKKRKNFHDPRPPNPNADERFMERWQTQVGQVWVIPSANAEGDHRLGVGDCTDAPLVKRVLMGETPLLCVTDPPYGVNYDADWRRRILNSSIQNGTIENDDKANWADAIALAMPDVLYMWHAAVRAGEVQFAIEELGYDLRYQIIWRKPAGSVPISRGAYHWAHEPCMYFVRRGKAAHWQGSRKETSVWEVDNRSQTGRDPDDPNSFESGHSTQKPVELYTPPIRNHLRAGQWLYEPFAGSGTAFIAAELEQRLCRGIELHPPYAAAILQRLADMGLEPRLEDAPETQEGE